MRQYNAELAIAEARAQGHGAEATRMEEELKMLNEKRKLINELGVPEAEAANMAARSVIANRKTPQANGVADSLRAIGGGGNFFAGANENVQGQQLRVQEQIRDGIGKLLEKADKGGSLKVSIF